MSEVLKKHVTRAIEKESSLLSLFEKLPSRLLHWIGCLVIGTPQALGMPADFYFLHQDRAMPTPDERDNYKKLRFRVYVNNVRIAMIRRICKVVFAINLVVVATCGVIFLASNAVSHYVSQWRSDSTVTSNKASTPDLFGRFGSQ